MGAGGAFDIGAGHITPAFAIEARCSSWASNTVAVVPGAESVGGVAYGASDTLATAWIIDAVPIHAGPTRTASAIDTRVETVPAPTELPSVTFHACTRIFDTARRAAELRVAASVGTHGLTAFA